MSSPQDELLTDYSVLPQLAAEKKEENDFFKNFLKKFPSAALDRIFQPIANSVTEKIDCTQCGNCCRYLEPGITEEEAGTLASLKSMSREIFIRDFTQREVGTETLFMNHQPCIFFDGKLCMIYDQRPASCQDFPHLAKENFKFRFTSIMANYAICPIVFNSVEKLKEQLKFSDFDMARENFKH
ncbi:MAG: YkgJ family cysteine cluster protein [Chitinophagales bacterium]